MIEVGKSIKLASRTYQVITSEDLTMLGTVYYLQCGKAFYTLKRMPKSNHVWILSNEQCTARYFSDTSGAFVQIRRPTASELVA